MDAPVRDGVARSHAFSFFASSGAISERVVRQRRGFAQVHQLRSLYTPVTTRKPPDAPFDTSNGTSGGVLIGSAYFRPPTGPDDPSSGSGTHENPHPKIKISSHYQSEDPQTGRQTSQQQRSQNGLPDRQRQDATLQRLDDVLIGCSSKNYGLDPSSDPVSDAPGADNRVISGPDAQKRIPSRSPLQIPATRLGEAQTALREPSPWLKARMHLKCTCQVTASHIYLPPRHLIQSNCIVHELTFIVFPPTCFPGPEMRPRPSPA